MPPNPTPYPEVNGLLDQLLAQFDTILATSLVGIYLYGSLVTGDWDDSSDVDVLVITEVTLNDNQFDALQSLHETLVAARPEWKDRLEVAYLSRHALATFRTQTSTIAITSLGEPFHWKEVGSHYLPNWYVVQEKGLTLFGPPPGDLIDLISRVEFVAAVKAHVQAWDKWLGDTPSRGFQSYAILSLCRACYTVTHGEQASKQHAALWVASQFPDWSPLIHNALHWRRTSNDPANPTLTLPDTRKFVAFMQAQILGRAVDSA